MSDFSKKFLADSSVFINELNLITDEEWALFKKQMSGYMKMKSIINGENFQYPAQSDYSDASWLLESSPFTIGTYERSYLEKLIEAFKAKESMLIDDYNEARFIVLNYMAQWDEWLDNE